MSSTYDILCLGHHPAITAAEDMPTLDQAIAWVADPPVGHRACDLLIARYSDALIELGCPGKIPGAGHWHPGWHGHAIWAEAGLLRVAAAVIETEDDGHADVLTNSLKRMPMCWTVERLTRLRHVLEVAR